MKYTKQILTAICLMLSGMLMAQGQSKKVVADKVVAVVGDRVILQSDIKTSLQDAERQGATLPPNAFCMLMDQALVSKVLMLQAEKDSLPVTDEDVEAELDQRIRYFIRELGSKEELERVAGKTVYQIKDDARESVRERKLAEAMQQKIVGSVKITPTEVKTYFDRIPQDSLPFFESELEVGQIVLLPKASRDLEQYIFTEMLNYKKQIESKATTFEQLAKQVSQDPGSKDRGGFYQINRNEKSWDPVFLSTAFRLKNGEISVPVKSDNFGYFLIQMVDRRGDDADVRMILRIPPVTDAEIVQGKAKLDSIRTRILAGSIAFNDAARQYSEDPTAKFAGPFFTNRDGSPYITIDQLDNETVAVLRTLKVGEISTPAPYTADQGKKGVRIVYLKSRSEPHRMNLRDDYSKIAGAALEEKKREALSKWIETKMDLYYINVDRVTAQECPNLQRYKSEETAGL
ncbi:MAG: peptidylprolyl isomerase [Chitinophagaceae bacterium]|jgi:peptidyl-prolyl cis-trans isomerase SurA|nr:peptidylprolyl isomerase [Chitinophagaceae bacterium]